MTAEQHATVILIRHGETEWNHDRRLQGQTDVPLNGTGIAQARAAAEALLAYGPAAVYSSDLSRAAQTADIAARRLGLSVQLDPRLRERHFGIVQGLTMEAFAAAHPALYAEFNVHDPDFSVPGGETAAVFHARAVASVRDIAARHLGRTVAVVAHGGVLSAVFREAFAIPVAVRRNFDMINASVNIFRISSQKLHLVSWGLTGHLTGLNNGSPLL